MSFSYEVKSGDTVLPAGTYVSRIDRAELKTNAAGVQRVFVLLRVSGPTRANLTAMVNFNIFHERPSVREIAEKSFDQFLLALEIQSINDLSILIGREIGVVSTGKSDFYRFIPAYKVQESVALQAKDIVSPGTADIPF